MNKDYIFTSVEQMTQPGGERMSQPRTVETSELCQCPCHQEGLECHSCYAVSCRTILFDAELKRITASKHDLLGGPRPQVRTRI